MDSPITKKSNSTTELLLSEFLTSQNQAILDQVKNYKKVLNIYERSLLALGRKVAFKSTNSSTETVKIKIQEIGATNKI